MTANQRHWNFATEDTEVTERVDGVRSSSISVSSVATFRSP
jgi:hypothetical protein